MKFGQLIEYKGGSPFSECESCYCKIRSLSMRSISCTSEFAVELRKIEEKDEVMVYSYAMFKSQKQSVVLRCSSEKVFLKIPQISQENNYVDVSF